MLRQAQHEDLVLSLSKDESTQTSGNISPRAAETVIPGPAEQQGVLLRNRGA